MTTSTLPQTSPYDGLVSRHLNRRISRPIAKLLAHTPVTPNQVTVFSLGIAVASLVAFATGNPIAGGLLAQAGSIIDGVDGDLARFADKSSKFGSFFDAVVDRFSDSLVMLGLTVWAASGAETMLPWIAGFAALAGSFAVTYTRARVDESRRTMFDNGITSLASRDVRLLLIMIGAVAGYGVETLLTLAVLAIAVVLLRVVSARRVLE
ncbi:MAG: CDP-alcohol phosphatidyltransferase family protein [Chloroflexota bacterium]|nr:CDP-alcohol phosphatidyltransferase family protein [Chloroflexota bacterium]MDE2883759.1 CDP-alcohol phosphatidyltransferase family protein [Chloroflexota bacterium]